MDKDKHIEELYRKIWWQELQHKARERYLLRRLGQVEEELARAKADKIANLDK